MRLYLRDACATEGMVTRYSERSPVTVGVGDEEDIALLYRPDVVEQFDLMGKVWVCDCDVIPESDFLRSEHGLDCRPIPDDRLRIITSFVVLHQT